MSWFLKIKVWLGTPAKLIEHFAAAKGSNSSGHTSFSLSPFSLKINLTEENRDFSAKAVPKEETRALWLWKAWLLWEYNLLNHLFSPSRSFQTSSCSCISSFVMLKYIL